MSQLPRSEVVRVGDGVALSGRAASLVARALNEWRCANRHVAPGAWFEPTYAVLVEAGAEWERRVSDSGSRTPQPTDECPQSMCEQLIDTSEAAVLLGRLTSRRVRQLVESGELTPVRRTKPMLFDRAEVLAYREGRKTA